MSTNTASRLTSAPERRPPGRPAFLTGHVEVFDGIRVRPEVAEVFLRELAASSPCTKADLFREALDVWVESIQGEE